MSRSNFLAVVTSPLRSIFMDEAKRVAVNEVRRELELEAMRVHQSQVHQFKCMLGSMSAQMQAEIDDLKDDLERLKNERNH